MNRRWREAGLLLVYGGCFVFVDVVSSKGLKFGRISMLVNDGIYPFAVV